MDNLKVLIFMLSIGFIGLAVCVYSIICIIKNRINKIGLYYGEKKEVISFKKDPRKATINLIGYLILAVLCFIPIIISILIYLGIIK
ncbi:hypothetical protein COV16_00930 [Candidatus Woesearchaeota archaeon CG10_big_fil_rev_8_21_14_0_10_34_8]|nr:MAG: hypothetical protein COV16_00930 [Candidatus Woesearchaeota archaeon CG10_big_fil_rev_8_21_14_0_10_34_8]